MELDDETRELLGYGNAVDKELTYSFDRVYIERSPKEALPVPGTPAAKARRREMRKANRRKVMIEIRAKRAARAAANLAERKAALGR